MWNLQLARPPYIVKFAPSYAFIYVQFTASQASIYHSLDRLNAINGSLLQRNKWTDGRHSSVVSCLLYDFGYQWRALFRLQVEAKSELFLTSLGRLESRVVGYPFLNAPFSKWQLQYWWFALKVEAWASLLWNWGNSFWYFRSLLKTWDYLK